jgi:hypothetical protein
MSNICLPDGVTLDPNFLAGNLTENSSKSRWIHINQARPAESPWPLWQQACSHWSHEDKLHFPLGKWLKPGDQLRREWPYYYDYKTGDFYVRQLIGYLRCIATDPIRFSPISTIEWQPTSSSTPVQARLAISGDAWILTIPPPPTVIPIASTPATFVKFLDNLKSWETELFSDLTLNYDCYAIIDLVENQQRHNT